MKVAIIFSGFFRTFDFVKESLNRCILEPTNADVYFRSPTTFYAEKKDENPDWHWFHSANDKVIDQAVYDFFGERLAFGATRDYDSTYYRDIIATEGLPERNFCDQFHWRTLSQIHSMQVAVEAFRAHAEPYGLHYDAVIFTRMDIKWYSPFRTDALNLGKINHTMYDLMRGDNPAFANMTQNERNEPNHRKRVGYAAVHGTDKSFNDHVIVGSQRNILAFGDIYDKMLGYTRSGVPFNTETIIGTHLMRKGIEWQPSDFGTFELWRYEKERWD